MKQQMGEIDKRKTTTSRFVHANRQSFMSQIPIYKVKRNVQMTMQMHRKKEKIDNQELRHSNVNIIYNRCTY